MKYVIATAFPTFPTITELPKLVYGFRIWHIVFANNNMCMIWGLLTDIKTPPLVTTDILYIRFIEGRTIQEQDFGKIQKDRISEMKITYNSILVQVFC
jgi:hypothetical protein